MIVLTAALFFIYFWLDRIIASHLIYEAKPLTASLQLAFFISSIYLFLSLLVAILTRRRLFVWIDRVLAFIYGGWIALDAICVFILSQHLRWTYIWTAIQPGFIEHSGITQATLTKVILLVLGAGLFSLLFLIVEDKFFPQMRRFINRRAIINISILGAIVILSWPNSHQTSSNPTLDNQSLQDSFNFRSLETISVTSRPSVFLIICEGIRPDVVSQETMPNLMSFNGHFFEQNYSTANATHFGVFTLLSGLFPSYYKSAVETEWAFPILNLLKKNGYKTAFLSGEPIGWMSLDKIISPNHFDYFFSGNNKDLARGDRLTVFEFQKILMKSRGPGFYVLKLNGTHHNYYYPPEYEKFKPVIPIDFNYASFDLRDQAHLIKNRYLNSVYSLDSLLGKIRSILEAQGLWDHSIVVVASDHGEEFFETGKFLHSTDLNKYQNSALFYLKAPHLKKPLSYDLQTSHLDIIPTLLGLLGYQKPRWLKGYDLLKEVVPERRVVFSAWHNGLNLGILSYNRGDMVLRQDTQPATLDERALVDDARLFLKPLQSE